MKPYKIISLLFALLVVGWLVARWGGDFKLAVPSEGSPPAEGAGEGDVGPVVAFKPFVVTAWDGNSQHISRVTFEVEVSDAEARDTLKARTSEVRSQILALLADTNLTEIGAPEDFATLKAKVQDRVQALMPGHSVRRVLITDFLSK